MTSGSRVERRAEFRIAVRCMYRGHGRLLAYQDALGRLSVKPCEKCLANAQSITSEEWRRKVSDAIGANGA